MRSVAFADNSISALARRADMRHGQAELHWNRNSIRNERRLPVPGTLAARGNGSRVYNYKIYELGLLIRSIEIYVIVTYSTRATTRIMHDPRLLSVTKCRANRLSRTRAKSYVT